MTAFAKRSCPLCGHSVPLESALALPELDALISQTRQRLLACPSCSCAFFDPQPDANYAEEPIGGDAALAFYLQQGAGVWSIASTLLTLDLPGPRRMLEVGCGFGFGLDVARSILNWDAQGFDPSPFAAAGAIQLNLSIENRYFEASADQQASHDVVVCSEVLEHLHDPVAFLRSLRGVLRPDGVLVLTTPNAAAIAPGTSSGILVPLLSVGYHTVLHTSTSLTYSLHQAGFANISVEDRGPSLLARASGGPLPLKDVDVACRDSFRHYLEATGLRAEAGSDLGIGLLVRAFREAVAVADMPAAERLRLRIWQDIAQRFGARPDDLAATSATSPEDLARQEPFCLGPLLLTRATQLALLGDDGQGRAMLLERAAAAAERARAALGTIGVDDADCEDVAWVARAELLIVAAQAGEAGLDARLAALGPAPGSTVSAHERAAILRRRCFVGLVNSNSLDNAASLDDVIPGVMRKDAADGPLRDDELDVLYCGAVLAANAPPGDPETALARAQALRRACLGNLARNLAGSAAILLWPGVTIEALMLRRLDRRAELDDLARHVVPALASRPDTPPRPAPSDLDEVLRR